MTLTLEQVKARSADKLNDPYIHPAVKAAGYALIELAYAAGVYIDIYEGYRSITYQNSLYAKGRTAPGPKVTDARGGRSYHNFGLALDFALLTLDGKRIEWDTVRDYDRDGKRDWSEVVEIAQRLGFEWGITLKGGTVDHPHIQMTFGLATAELRAGKRPTESQTQVALARIERVRNPVPVTVICEEKNEEADELKLSNYQRAELISQLQGLTDRKVINSDEWVKKAKDGTLTVSELTWLNTILLCSKLK